MLEAIRVQVVLLEHANLSKRSVCEQFCILLEVIHSVCNLEFHLSVFRSVFTGEHISSFFLQTGIQLEAVYPPLPKLDENIEYNYMVYRFQILHPLLH